MKIKKLITLCLMLITMLTLTGCSKTGQDFVGKWYFIHGLTLYQVYIQEAKTDYDIRIEKIFYREDIEKSNMQQSFWYLSTNKDHKVGKAKAISDTEMEVSYPIGGGYEVKGKIQLKDKDTISGNFFARKSSYIAKRITDEKKPFEELKEAKKTSSLNTNNTIQPVFLD